MSNNKSTRRQGPRGSRGDVESVRQNAAAAGKELEAERVSSVGELAQALGEISEGEGLAHLESRLSFIERQVERLAARRDDADRGVQGELAVMRARVEDALEAVGATAEQQKESLASLEKRLAGIVGDAERGSADVVSALRQEIIAKVQSTATRLEKLDARIRGELKAFEEGFEERSRTLTLSVSESSETFESRLTEATEELAVRVDRASAQAELALAEQREIEGRLNEELQAELEASKTRIVEDVTTRVADLEDKVAALSIQATRAVEEATARIGGLLEDAAAHQEQLDERIEAHRGDLEERFALQQREVEERFSNESRETEGRLSEWGAEIRLESQKLREEVDNRSRAFSEGLDIARRDLLARIQASEEKTAGAAIRLQSLLDQQRREIVTGEEEWSSMLKEVTEELTTLKIWVEELAGRVSAAEARRAAERGSSHASVEGVAGRVEALEQRVREAVEEMVAKQGTRLEVLASQVASINETEVAAEEQIGAVDYLKRRVGDMAERLDEIVVKVNAIGRYVTKPNAATRLRVDPAFPPDLDDRLVAIEKAIEQLAGTQAAAGSDELLDRLEALEQLFERLQAPAQPDPAVVAISNRLEALERVIGDLSAAIAPRPETSGFKATSTTILPTKKRRR